MKKLHLVTINYQIEIDGKLEGFSQNLLVCVHDVDRLSPDEQRKIAVDHVKDVWWPEHFPKLKGGRHANYLSITAEPTLQAYPGEYKPKRNEYQESQEQPDVDLYEFANYALGNASAIASNKTGETINFGVTMEDVKRWKEEKRPHFAKGPIEGHIKPV